MKAIVNGILLLPDCEVKGQALLYDHIIRALVPQDQAAAQADEILDAQGLYVSPGLIDVHIHGYGGDDVSDDDPEGIRRMAGSLLPNGVTSFLPTTLTVPWPRLESVCRHMRALAQESRRADFPGAQILGVHLEGPFINPAYKGAQNPDCVLPPDAERVLPWADIVKVITLAPEMPGAEECIRILKQRTPIALSMGHTGATFEQAQAAIGWGVTRATHLFNAMTPLHHRNPGAVGAALNSDIYTELIADTFHVHPGIFPMLAQAKPHRLVLITDALRAAGMPDGDYEIGGQRFRLQGIACRLPDGTIAGSVLKMNQAVKNLKDHGHIPLWQAVRAASLNAAASAGLDVCKGSLTPGKDADIVLMDGDCRVAAAIDRGVCKYQQAL